MSAELSVTYHWNHEGDVRCRDHLPGAPRTAEYKRGGFRAMSHESIRQLRADWVAGGYDGAFCMSCQDAIRKAGGMA